MTPNQFLEIESQTVYGKSFRKSRSYEEEVEELGNIMRKLQKTEPSSTDLLRVQNPLQKVDSPAPAMEFLENIDKDSVIVPSTFDQNL